MTNMKNARSLGNLSRASDRIAEDMRKKIMTLELPPGATVTEDYLRELLECSQTPLREALLRLADERLVVAVPRKGVSIAHMSLLEWTHLMEALSCLETFLIPLAAARAEEADLNDLQALLDQMGEANDRRDFARWTELDFLFHTRISAVASNPYIHDAESRALRLAARFVFLSLSKIGTAEGPMSDHREIIEALRSGDPDRAKRATLDHHDRGRERMRAAL